MNLLIDADDTLWPNAIHFNQARLNFRDILESRGTDPVLACEGLERQEQESLARGWYGSTRLNASMRQVAGDLLGNTHGVDSEIDRITSAVRDHVVHLYPGVLETLERLSPHHRLFLVTMGDLAEQEGKIGRSGVVEYFEAVDIVPEKNSGTYRSIMERHGLEPGSSWMIGNSPSKDVLPALEAGLRTVHFACEVETAMDPSGPCETADIVIGQFDELLDYFEPGSMNMVT